MDGEIDEELVLALSEYVRARGHEGEPVGDRFIDLVAKEVAERGRVLCICGCSMRVHVLRALRANGHGQLERTFRAHPAGNLS